MYDGVMNPKLKTLLKIATAVVIPGAGIYFLTKYLAEEIERREFKNYIQEHYSNNEEENYDDL